MKEESRRRIARKFLEEKFGKQWKPFSIEKLEELKKAVGIMPFKILMEGLYSRNFELYRSWDSMMEGAHDNEARAFEVLYAPYSSSAEKKMIAISDNNEELAEIVDKCFEKNDVKYADYKGYKVAYD